MQSTAVMLVTAVLCIAAISQTPLPPTVDIDPVERTTGGPNEGTWFVFEADPGETVRSKARIVNIADVPQRVSLTIRDLSFTDAGSPILSEDQQVGIGAWSRVHDRELVVPPDGRVTADFEISIPADVRPGDHIGAIVAETTHAAGTLDYVTRAATRIYVTVPGEASTSFIIQDVQTELDSFVWPRSAEVTAWLRNDGKVRLTPNVKTSGQDATGADLLMSRSVEPYVAQVPVPWFGGPVRMNVEVRADAGLVRTATKTVWVIPWGLIILVVVAASALYAIRRWWKERKSATAELKQDIQRLEQLITQQAKAQESTAAVGTGLPPTELPEDEEAIILAALKRARRSNDDTALARIALAKHMTSGDGLDLILEALGKHDGKHRDALLDAAVSYGADALSPHERFGRLPEQTQTELGERLVTSGETVSGTGNGKPPKVPQPVVGQTDSDALRNELAKVKGVGPAKQEALVSRFGSLDAIRSAEVEDLTDVPGIGFATAREILDQLDG